MVGKGKPVVIERGRLPVEGRPVPYTLKRSARARYVRLEVDPGIGLIIVMPQGYDRTALPALLEHKKRWLASKLAHFPLAGDPGREIAAGDVLCYLGKSFEVVALPAAGAGRESVSIEDSRLVVTLRPGADLGAALLEWYRRQARLLFAVRAKEASQRMNVTYRRLIVRGQRTRWGSCSQRGTLSFNWRLLMAPPEVLDYVVMHEVAHLKHLNHTKRFWTLLARHCPEWRERRRWLREHEDELAAPLSSARG